MNTRHKRNIITFAPFASLAFVALAGAPFRFADGNNGRYLTTVYRIIDPTLFPADPLVDAFARFQSIFYTGFGLAFKFLSIQVLDVEMAFYALYVLSKILLMAVLYFLVKPVDEKGWAFLLLGAWAVHSKSANVSGESLFAPTMNHAVIAILLGITALACYLRGKTFLSWVILAFSLFVHSINSLHLALMLAPVMFWQARGRLNAKEWAGLGLFAAAFLAYLAWMTPPAFTAQETALFLQAKGEMVHISPLAHPVTGWLAIVGRVALAFLAWKVYLADQKKLAGFMLAMLAGAFLAPTLGFLAIWTGQLQLAQLQPLRMFEWVNFLAFLLIILATFPAWQKNRWLAVLFGVNIALNILDSLWGLAWLYLGVLALGLEWLSTKITWPSPKLLFLPRTGMLALVVPMLFLLIFGNSHSFESFRDPLPVLVTVILLAILFLPLRFGSLGNALVGLALVVTLAGRTAYVHDYISARQNGDYNAMCRWIALNTEKDARFITAIQNGGNFRACSLRTSLNEAQSALYWVAPLVARQNGEDAAMVASLRLENGWDEQALYQLGAGWQADYILIETNAVLLNDPLYSQGIYHLLAVKK